jgi:small subunit ribosomal protein S6
MQYEFMAIIKPFLPEDIRVKLQGNIKRIFTSKGGKVEKEDVWGKRHLAYKIKGHEEGYYIVYDIILDEVKLSSAQEELKLINDLLRFIVTKKEK